MECRVVSVFRFRNKWRADFRWVDGKANASRNRMRRVINAEDEQEAREIAELTALRLTESEGRTVAEGLRGFSEEQDQGEGGPYRHETVAGYRTAARRAALQMEGLWPSACASEITEDDARRYVQARIGSGGAVNSIRQELTVLKDYYEHLVRKGAATANPFANVTAPKKKLSGPPTPMRRADLLSLLETMRGQTGAAGWIAYDCQLLASEIAALSWDDFQPDLSALVASRAIGQDGQGRVLAAPKERACCPELRFRLATLRYSERGCREPYLFGHAGKPPNPTVLSRKFSSATQALGVKTTLCEMRRLGKAKTGKGGRGCISQ